MLMWVHSLYLTLQFKVDSCFHVISSSLGGFIAIDLTIDGLNHSTTAHIQVEIDFLKGPPDEVWL